MHWLAFSVSRCGKEKMPSQIFILTRAPEAEPIDARQLHRMISAERPDSEWDVAEYELQPAALVPCEVARAFRAKANAGAVPRASETRMKGTKEWAR